MIAVMIAVLISTCVVDKGPEILADQARINQAKIVESYQQEGRFQMSPDGSTKIYE